MSEQAKPVTDLFGENKSEPVTGAAAPLFGEKASSQPEAAPLFGESVSPQSGTVPLFGESAAPQSGTAPLFGETPVSLQEQTPVQPVPEVEEKPVPPVPEKVEEKPVSPALEQPRIIEDAESRPVKELQKHTPLVRRTVVPSLSVENSSIGEFMSDLRRQSGCSLDDVASSTKIRIFYIEAIEKDDFDQLPLGSFPAAYIRSLCGFYGLEGSVTDQLIEKTGKIKRKEKAIPKEIIEQIGSTATYNENEEKKLMRIVCIGGAVLALILIGIIGLIVWFLLPGDSSAKQESGNSAPAVQNITADDALFDKLTAPETPEVRTLPVPAGK